MALHVIFLSFSALAQATDATVLRYSAYWTCNDTSSMIFMNVGLVMQGFIVRVVRDQKSSVQTIRHAVMILILSCRIC